MFITTPEQLNSILNHHKAGRIENHELQTISSIHRENVLFYLEHKEAIPKPEDTFEASKYILVTTRVVLNLKQMETILSLFPFVRIKLALEGINSTEMEDLLYDVAFKFFAGCEAPRNKDKINIDKLIRYLQSQAKELRYQVKESETTTK